MKISLVIIVLVTQILIIIIPFSGKISDNRRQSLQKFTKLGYGLIGTCIVSFVASLILIRISNNEETKNKIEFENALKVRDSINQKKITDSQKDIYEAFAKYGLKYDFARDEISKLIKDSTQVTIINPNKPFLFVSNIKSKQEEHKLIFDICFTSKMAVSYKINLKVDLIEYDSISTKYKYLGKDFYFLTPNSEISQDKFLSATTILENPNTNIKNYFFHFKGFYEDVNTKK